MSKHKSTPTLSHDGKLENLSNFGLETWNIKAYPQNWQAFLKSATKFYYQGENIGFTVRKEKRSETLVWYGYKKVAGKLYNVYVGAYLSLDILNQAADKLLEKISIGSEVTRETDPKADMDSHLLSQFEPLQPVTFNYHAPKSILLSQRESLVARQIYGQEKLPNNGLSYT